MGVFGDSIPVGCVVNNCKNVGYADQETLKGLGWSLTSNGERCKEHPENVRCGNCYWRGCSVELEEVGEFGTLVCPRCRRQI